MPRSKTDNGGIAGSGIFGLVGSTVNCKAEDTGLFCTMMKIVNFALGIFILGFLIWFVMGLIKKRK